MAVCPARLMHKHLSAAGKEAIRRITGLLASLKPYNAESYTLRSNNQSSGDQSKVLNERDAAS